MYPSLRRLGCQWKWEIMKLEDAKYIDTTLVYTHDSYILLMNVS